MKCVDQFAPNTESCLGKDESLEEKLFVFAQIELGGENNKLRIGHFSRSNTYNTSIVADARFSYESASVTRQNCTQYVEDINRLHKGFNMIYSHFKRCKLGNIGGNHLIVFEDEYGGL